MTNDVELLFLGLLAIPRSSFVKFSFRSFLHFLLSCLFIVSSQEICTYSEWESFIRQTHCEYFLPVCGSLILAKSTFFYKLETNSFTPIRSLAPMVGKPVVSDKAQRRLPCQMPGYTKAGSCWFSSGGPQSVQRCSYVLGTWRVSRDTWSCRGQD